MLQKQRRWESSGKKIWIRSQVCIKSVSFVRRTITLINLKIWVFKDHPVKRASGCKRAHFSFLPFSFYSSCSEQHSVCYDDEAWLVSAVSLTFCYGACLAYTLCLGDVTSSLAQTIGLNGIWTSRQFCITFLATTVLYPLCKLKSLISLAPLSLAGVGSVLITAVFIAWRCPFVNQNSPYLTMGVGSLLSTLSPEQVPKFQTFNKGLLNPSSLILFGMAASAYL